MNRNGWETLTDALANPDDIDAWHHHDEEPDQELGRGHRLGLLRSGSSRPLAMLHRVYATPQDVAAVGEQFVCHGRLPTGEYGAEWEETSHVRATIERFRATLRDPEGLWTGGG